MKILGIESSCDETAVSIVENGRTILSNVVASQIEKHIKFGGVVPEIASREHIRVISQITKVALNEAGLRLSDLDAIAVTQAPGLIGSLLVGVNFAKGLAYGSGLPLVPVHHIKGHIAANYITFKGLKPPFLALVVSGGHSHIIQVKDYTDLHVLGRTHDDAAGETMDKVARVLGLPYPGGVNLDKQTNRGNQNAYNFPRPRIDGMPYDFSFSGLKTAAINQIHNTQQKGEEINLKDFGASLMYSVADILCDNLFKAANDFGYNTVVLAGGVSANSILRSQAKKRSEEQDKKLYLPELYLCGDNAAMIAAQGYYEFLNGTQSELDLNAQPTMQI